MLTFEEWRHTYADVFETDDAARAAWTAASNNGYRAGVRDTRALLAAHSDGAQEPVAEGEFSKDYDLGYQMGFRIGWKTGFAFGAGKVTLEEAPDEPTNYVSAQPQPMPQTDAARDAKRYQWLRAQHEMQDTFEDSEGFTVRSPAESAWTVFRPGRITSLEPVSCIPGELDKAIDAEIERLDRAKGE